MSDRKLTTRQEVNARIVHEGGYTGALEAGITEDDMPADDSDLRLAWRKLALAFSVASLLAADVDKLLGTIQ